MVGSHTMNAHTLTVILPVYHGTDADELQASLDSVLNQTRPPEAIVIVEDGPISPAVDEVITQTCGGDGDEVDVDTHPRVRRLRFTTNQGAGRASAAALEVINTELIARQDCDDISYPERFERQCAQFENDPELSALGTAMTEFSEHPRPDAHVRRLPSTPEEIARYMAMNNPINHPTLMARTADIRDVGGYTDVHFMEDYDLMARLVAAGKTLRNLPEPLVHFRTGEAQYRRRTGSDMWRAEIQMQRNLTAYGIVSRPRAVFNLLLRTGYRMLPRKIYSIAYSCLFTRRTRSR